MRLSQTRLLVAALGLGSLDVAAAGCWNDGLEACLQDARIPFKVKCDSDWGSYNKSANTRLPFQPAAVAIPTSPLQVSRAVRCAGKHRVKVQAKSGGNSYGAFSLGGLDGQLTIDLAHFNQTVLAGDGVTAIVGGGVLLGHMATDLFNQNKRAVSHGVCPPVGIGGHSTHGGWGYTSRAWGLTLDHILELEVVLANGTIVKASPKVNPDVFWAMRGAADSIGIAVSFKLRTQPAPEEVINFRYEWTSIYESVDAAVDLFSKLQSYISNPARVDRRLSFSLQTIANPSPNSTDLIKVLRLEGTFLGSFADYNTTIEPFMLADLPEPLTRDTESNNYLDSLKPISPTGNLNTAPMYLDFFANSVTVDSPGMSEAAIRSYFDYMINGPKPSAAYLSSMELWGGADSQINRPDIRGIDFAAYPHRNVFWTAHNMVRVGPGQPFPEEAITWLQGLRQAIIESTTVHTAAYPNLLDTTLSRDEAHEVYFGPQVLPRLKSIKKKVDPWDLYWNPHSL
ncbi:hypothetical protein VTJ83DRAFT_7517 [Remersonia thermophila]|uniref:FAD-binding PCMH-type domain-containing protein n=1 Tax=Remersonia thermophila TaxID=72144 RepID=A0ABR4D635_9PEZI